MSEKKIYIFYVLYFFTLILYIYRVAERRVNLVIFIKNKLSVKRKDP